MIAAFVAAIGPAWTWILIGLVLMGAELIASGVFLLWLGLAALVTGLQILLVPLPWQGQLLLFAALSVAFAVVASRRTQAGANALNQGAQGLLGRDYPLAAAIVDGEGHIRVNDTLWRVAGPDAPLGTRVRVTGVEGTLLTVVALPAPV
ncbi:NfeD family protein [Methylobacterium sp. 37f]|uniref:NfeD family protein n=1 Tax=Methylobacterium sp. 37f TaxID=2817058 RepID=UPI001FFD8BE7|nr:NfeD family protein [Methylobacterium sp. 37f]MCK2053873.1 NfeD family protein [Methylobacterium sp. 37f]